MPRKTQRDFRPTAIVERNLDIINITDTVESSITLATGADTIFTITTGSLAGVPIFVQEDISLFETSVAEANLIPNGSSINAGHYQIIGPWREQDSGDEKNIVSRIYIRNTTTAATDFSKRVAASSDDGRKEKGEVWSDSGQSITIGEGTSDDLIAAFRFLDVTIPQGETINTATITLKANVTDSDNISVTITGIDEDNTGDFSSDPTARLQTTASVSWSINGATLDATEQSPDMALIVQEIVDRGGWSSGNAIGFFVDNDASGNNINLNFYAYDWPTTGPDDAALLAINYGSASSKTVLFRGRTRYITSREDVTIS